MRDTHKIECALAAEALDVRRIEHELEQPRTPKIVRPATREEMENYVNSFGVTDLTSADSLRHVPVRVEPDGIAFWPERMTLAALEDTYLFLRRYSITRPDDTALGKVRRYLEDNPGGSRLQDIVAAVGYTKPAVLRVLRKLENTGDVYVREETNPRSSRASARKRYFLRTQFATISMDEFEGGI